MKNHPDYDQDMHHHIINTKFVKKWNKQMILAKLKIKNRSFRD